MTPRGKGHWSAERIVEAMVSWAAEHGAPPTRRDWNYSGDGHPGGEPVYRVFGSWETALRAAGFKDRADEIAAGRDRYPAVSPDEISDAIIDWMDWGDGTPPSLLDWHPELAEHQGYPERAERWRAEGWPHAVQAQRAHGSWNAAIESAGAVAMPSGVKRSSRAGRAGGNVEVWTPERVTAAIGDWARLHGSPPRYSDWWPRALDDPRWPAMRTVCRAWGSFPAALRSAGFSGRRRRRSSDRNAEIVERWNAGEPEWYIAAEMRLSGNQVRYEVDAARRRGEDVGLHRKRNREDWPEIERLYHEGLTYREIGERIGGSVDVVAVAVKKMRRAGYDLPRRR